MKDFLVKHEDRLLAIFYIWILYSILVVSVKGLRLDWIYLISIFGILSAIQWCHIIYACLFSPIKVDQFLLKTSKGKYIGVALAVIGIPVILYTVMFFIETVCGSRNIEVAMRIDKSIELLWMVLCNFVAPSQNNMAQNGWYFLIGMFGIFFVSGLLVSTIINLVDLRAKNYLSGQCRYDKNVLFCRPFKNKRVVLFLGSHPVLFSIIKKQVENKDIDYFLILTSADVYELRSHLSSLLDGESYNKVIIYSGHREEAAEINTLPFYAIIEIYLLGEYNEVNHDSINIQAKDNLEKESDRLKGDVPIKCHVLFETQSVFTILQSKDMPSVSGNRKLEFIAYNFYELWAQKVFMNAKGDEHNYIEGNEPVSEDDDSYVHLVVVGMSRMGVALALQAARICHYPNFEGTKRKRRTRITFIDKNMDEEMNYFMCHYKSLMELSRWRYFAPKDIKNDVSYFGSNTDIDENKLWNNNVLNPDSLFNHLVEEDSAEDKNFIDIEWQFIRGGMEQVVIQNYLKNAVNGCRMTVAVCLPDISKSTASALHLPHEVLINAVRVLVYQKGSDSLLKCLKEAKNFYKKISSFGMFDECDLEILYKDIAEFLPYVYKIWDTNKDLQLSSEIRYSEFKDLLRRRKEIVKEEEWSKQVIWARWSNIYSAQCILSKLHSFGANLSMNEEKICKCLGIDMDSTVCFDDESSPCYKLAQVEHNRWNLEMLLRGFRPRYVTEEKEDRKLLAREVIGSWERIERLDEENKRKKKLNVLYIVAIPMIVGLLAEEAENKKEV